MCGDVVNMVEGAPKKKLDHRRQNPPMMKNSNWTNLYTKEEIG